MPFFDRERFNRVMKLSLPAALGAFVDMLQVLIDLVMVGRLEVAATAAVGIGLQFTGLFYTIMGILYVGSNALMSRFLGGGEEAQASRVFSTFLLLSLALAVPAVVLAATFADLPFWLMNAGGRVGELGETYLFVLAFALPAMMINQIVFSAFSAHADIRTPLKIKIAMSFLNMAISYVLIFGAFGLPGFGVGGAAAGTVAAVWLESLIYARLMLAKKHPFAFLWVFDRELTARGLKVGIPAGIERLLTYGSFLIFTRIIADFGTAVMAGYQVGLRIEGLAFMPGIGFTIAAMALTGRQLGAKKPEEAEKDALFTALSAGVLMGLAGLLMVIFAHPLMAVFSDDAEAIAEGALYLQIVGLSQVPLGVAFVLSGAFRGAGDSRTSLKINLLSMWFFRIIPAVALAVWLQSVLFVWLVILFETWVRAIWLFAVFRRGRWKSVKV